MRRRSLMTIVLFLFLCAGAHASDYKVRFYANPPFAVISVNGTVIGSAPGENGVDSDVFPVPAFTYPLPKHLKTCTDITLVTIKATWASGATKTALLKQICPKDAGKWAVRFERPDVPGADADQTFAANVYTAKAEAIAQQIRLSDAISSYMYRNGQELQWREQYEALLWELQRPRTCYFSGGYLYCN